MFTWAKKYSVGVKELDDQHKIFFKIANEILALTKKNTVGKHKLMMTLDKFLNYALYHFENEENYFVEFNCPQPGHLEAHEAFRKYFKKLYIQAEFGSEGEAKDHAKEAVEFAGSWILHHILVMDKGYTECFNEHDLK